MSCRAMDETISDTTTAPKQDSTENSRQTQTSPIRAARQWCAGGPTTTS
jgi:hypothetical protein